mmetsp:Transcript_31340/g.88870  ORF Transcript_31340/g.88870 Transcript_31340/m.88870 type:complete len:539 (-) Transcript_31340:384-2000(-)
MAADFLFKMFSEADLPFNKLLSEQPVDKAAEVPLQYLSGDVSGVLKSWLSNCSPEACEVLTMNLITAVFDGMPEYASKNAPVQPPKAKVGLLLLLSIVLRVHPNVMLGLCPALLSKGSAFTAPLRLPQTLWVLAQLTASGDVGTAVAVHTWCSVILPQVLGCSLPVLRQDPAKVAMMQKDASLSALSWMRETFRSAENSSPGFQDVVRVGIKGSAGGLFPAVPCGAVEAIVRVALGGELEGGEPAAAPKGIPSKAVRDGLVGILPDIRNISFQGAGSGAFPGDNGLVLALETAERSCGPNSGPGTRLVAECSRTVVAAFASIDSAFTKFEEKHKKMIKGTSRILQHLACEYPPYLTEMLSISGKAPLFSGLMTALRRRHQMFVEAGKGWQGACGLASEEAALKLGDSTRRMIAKQTGPRFISNFVAMLLVSGFAVGVAVYVVAEPENARALATRAHLPVDLVDKVIGSVPPEYTTQVRSGLTAAVAGSRELSQRLVAAVPSEVMEKIAPLLHSANHTFSSAASQLKQVASALAQQYTA